MAQSIFILIIEDDPAVGQSLEDALKAEGFLTILKTTGEEGLHCIQNSIVHLLLLDIRLPDGSGFDFCRRIRQMGFHLPILILTAQHGEMDKVLGLELGADDYVTKPFSLRELVSRIRSQLRRAYGDFSSNDVSMILISDLLINQDNGKVSRFGKEIALTPIEFRLLVHLARNKNRALTRPQLIDAVWGFAPDLDSEKTINVHIRHLREKIEIDPEKPSMILTVPGIGYRLVGFD